MSIYRFVLLGCVALLAFVQRSEAQQKPIPCKVSLSIAVDDSFVQDQVTSAISRALRQLGDVTLASDRNDSCFSIKIVGVTTENRAHDVTGIALSTTFTYAFSSEPFRKYLLAQTKTTQGTGQGIAYLLALALVRVPDDADIQLNQMVNTGSLDDIGSICQGIVAAFDTRVLSTERQLLQQIDSGNPATATPNK